MCFVYNVVMCFVYNVVMCFVYNVVMCLVYNVVAGFELLILDLSPSIFSNFNFNFECILQ